MPTLVLAGGVLGGVLLLVTELTTLYTVRGVATGRLVRSVGAGSNHAYALVVVALLVALLSFGVWRAHSRPALLALGLLGILVLLIALVGDLPDAHASGLLRLPSGRYAAAASRPGAGFFLETLAAVVLLSTCVGGFLLAGPPPRPRGARAADQAPVGTDL